MSKLTCVCPDLDTYLLHAMHSKTFNHHQFIIDGKDITLDQVWKLKEKIGEMKMRYKANVEMLLLDKGQIELSAYSFSRSNDTNDVSDIKKNKIEK